MKKIYLMLFTVCFAAITNAQVTLTATAGTAAGSFTTLKGAFDAINAGTHQGVIVISINASTTEGTTPATLNSTGAGPAVYTSVLIQPTADGLSISGNPATGFGVIQLKGADNITINGDNPGTAGTNKNLTVNNTNTATAIANSVIRIATVDFPSAGDANNIIIKNCILNGNVTAGNTGGITSTSSSSNSSFGIFVGGAGGITAIDAPTAITSVTTNIIPANTTVNNLLIDNNTISQTARGIEFNGAATNNSTGVTITNNLIGNSTSGIATGVYSMGMTVQGSSLVNVTNNTVYVESFLGTNIRAIDIGSISSNVTGVTIEKNIVGRVLNNSLGAFGAYGINYAGGINGIIQNNFLYGIINSANASSFSTSTGSFGIRVATTTGHKVYHNTVNMSGAFTGAGIVLTACLNIVSTSVTGCDVRNNIFSNTQTGGSGGSAYVCLYLPNAGTSTFNLTINNNAYYTGSTAGLHGICQAGAAYTNPVTTAGIGLYTAANFNQASSAPVTNLRNYTSTLLAANTNNENASLAFTSAAPFVSSTDLHISTGVTPTQLESGGAPVGVTTDIDGQVRPGPTGSVNGGASAPDLGADEFDGVKLDLTGPAITYTLFTNTTCTSNKTVAPVTITDASGVNVTVGTRPRVYYKRTSDANTFNNNTSGTAGWKFAEATNAVSPFSFTINGSLLFGGAPVVGDVIQYFIIAQDNVATPNVGINSGNFAAPPSSVALTAAAFPITGTIYSYTVLGGGLSGMVNIPTDYPSLSGAGGVFSAINSGGLSGNLQISILADEAAEDGSVALNAINYNGCAAGPYTLTIKPFGNFTLSGTAAGALITLNGADNVTIDGSTGATANTVCPASTASRGLTITNTNVGTSSAVIWMQTTAGADAATNNTVMNTNITGSGNTQTLFGIGSGASAISTLSLGTGNINNSFINNNISKIQIGIYSQGASIANKNTGTVINQNLINTVAPNNAGRVGIFTGFENNITISGNSISELSFSSGLDVVGIGLGQASLNASFFPGNEVTGATVSNNIIGSIRNTGQGSAAGIYVAPATSGINTLSNNMISGVSANATGGEIIAGMFIAGGTGSATRIYYNTVTMTSLVANPGATDRSYALAIAGTDPILDIRNNILLNTQNNGTGNNYAVGYGYNTFANLTSDHNDYFVTNPGATFFIGGTGSFSAPTSQATVANLQTATGKDGNAQNVSPVFTSATDLHLNTSASPNNLLDATGTPVSVTADIDCTTRNAGTPDIGADEFAFTGVVAVGVEYFRGTKVGTANYLDWKVNCSSDPSVRLILERSADGRIFTAVQDQNVAAARCAQGFNFTDASPLAGINYYRLKTISPDGAFRYSVIVALINKEKGFELISVTPNPVKTNTLLSISTVKADKMSIVVSDITGKVVLTQTINVIAGNNPVLMNFATLGAGTYNIKVINADNEVKSTRFVKY